MCTCCGSGDLDRRSFLRSSVAMTAAGWSMLGAAGASSAKAWASGRWNPAQPYTKVGKALRVQPVLMYRDTTPQKQASYKSWGDVQDESAAQEEARRISEELTALAKAAAFPIEIAPVILAKSPGAIRRVTAENTDATIVYPATGGGDMLRAMMELPNPLIFARHRSGHVYYWYEALSVRYLRTDRPEFEATREKVPPLSVHDVVIDDLEELTWKLRSLYAIHNTMGTRVLALGGAWGKYASEAPEVARTHYKMELIEYAYEDFEPRIRAALADPAKVKCAEEWTDQYLALGKTSLETERSFVVNAFLLYGLFKDLMEENRASAFTIRDCMRSIMPMSETTACLSLSLMNDEGTLAMCESDFVIMPPAVFLYHLCDTPVFMHNSTFPHNGMVTCAHCTGPRRMNGDRYEPVRILTHYESDYGAAPKVEMPLGQQLSFINPEYAVGRWVGLRGEVVDNPFLEICRSQQDVRVEGDWEKLMHEVRDSHWLMVYGDKLREIGYGAQRMGLIWDNISDRA